MKKLQMIAVLILTLLFVSACIPEDEDEEDFLNDDTTDTVPDENPDTSADTLPDNQTEPEPTDDPTEPTADPTNTTEPTNPTDPTEPTAEPTEPSDDSDAPSTDNDAAPVPDNDTEEPATSDDDVQPAADDDNESLTDEDSENPSDNDFTDNDAEQEADIDLTDNDIHTDYDIEPDDDSDSVPDADADTELPECYSGITAVCKDSSSSLIWSTLSSSQFKLAEAETYCNTLNEGGYPVGSWKLPNINDLKTLIQNCDRATNPDQCKVNDPDCLLSGTTCYDNLYCNNTNICKSNSDGSHSKLGDNMHIWSSSKCSDNENYAFMVMFLNGTIGKNKTNNTYKVRCVIK